MIAMLFFLNTVILLVSYSDMAYHCTLNQIRETCLPPKKKEPYELCIPD